MTAKLSAARFHVIILGLNNAYFPIKYTGETLNILFPILTTGSN
jgi:hypothetical protein